LQSGAIHMEIGTLYRHGWTISALAREFQLSRTTIREEVRSEEQRRYRARVRPKALNEAQKAHVRRRMSVCPQIRGTILYRELCREYGYDGSYPTFMREVRPLWAEPEAEPDVRFETDPGVQTQIDWAHLGDQRLGSELKPLFAMVAVLGASRVPSVRFATNRTRATTLAEVTQCLSDLGGVTGEILTDRDPAFCMGATRDGRAILAPEWVDLCQRMGTVPRACRPYRAKTKGKVERLVREVKEDFLPWLSGQVLPAEPSLDDYNRMARTWREEVILPRRHRTTGLVLAQAWQSEQPFLRSLPPGLPYLSAAQPQAPPNVIDLRSRLLGEHVVVRDLAEYEAAL
jgi:transposase